MVPSYWRIIRKENGFFLENGLRKDRFFLIKSGIIKKSKKVEKRC